MRIGMVTACYKPVMNGVTRMVALYKKRLEARGHKVTIFTLGEPDPAGEEANVLRSPALPLGDTGYYFSFRYSKQAQEQLRHMDIIHCHHLFMSVEMAHRYGNCPIVYTNHTRYDLYTGTYMPLPQPAADVLMRQLWPEFTDYCDVVITPSPGIRDVMREFGVRQRIEVIPNGIDLEPFRNPSQPHSRKEYGIPEKAMLLIYTGRLSTEKNLMKLLDQFAIAREIVPKLHLLFVGKGSLEEKLRQRTKELRLEQLVHFAGAMPYGEVGNVLALGDAYVTASISEVHPLGVIEGMAAGLPVAAVSSPGIEDTVEHGRSGLLTSAPEGLGAAITALVIDPQQRQMMGAAAREASCRYDIDLTVQQTLDLYLELRRTRPDLHRKKGHGRWVRRQAPPLLEQLAHLLRPPE